MVVARQNTPTTLYHHGSSPVRLLVGISAGQLAPIPPVAIAVLPPVTVAICLFVGRVTKLGCALTGTVQMCVTQGVT
jgi:hypothetical protein